MIRLSRHAIERVGQAGFDRDLQRRHVHAKLLFYRRSSNIRRARQERVSQHRQVRVPGCVAQRRAALESDGVEVCHADFCCALEPRN